MATSGRRGDSLRAVRLRGTEPGCQPESAKVLNMNLDWLAAGPQRLPECLQGGNFPPSRPEFTHRLQMSEHQKPLPKYSVDPEYWSGSNTFSPQSAPFPSAQCKESYPRLPPTQACCKPNQTVAMTAASPAATAHDPTGPCCNNQFPHNRGHPDCMPAAPLSGVKLTLSA